MKHEGGADRTGFLELQLQPQCRQDPGHLDEAKFTQAGIFQGIFQGIKRGTPNARFAGEHLLGQAHGLGSGGHRVAEIGERESPRCPFCLDKSQ